MEAPRDLFHTLRGESRAIYREKASKFIAVAMPVENEDEVKSHLDQLRKGYYDANHHCYAYRLGMENPLYRVNDDGEPSGSAGKPIYGQILSAELYQVLIVVIRYFGGTKLGVPGLIHAYKTSAREAIEAGEIVSKTIQIRARLHFPFESMNLVMRILKEEQAKITGQLLEQTCSLDIAVRKGVWDILQSRIGSLRSVNIDILK